MAIVSRAATTAGSPSVVATTRRWSMRCGPILRRDQRLGDADRQVEDELCFRAAPASRRWSG
jgi:hypothetical protein